MRHIVLFLLTFIIISNSFSQTRIDVWNTTPKKGKTVSKNLTASTLPKSFESTLPDGSVTTYEVHKVPTFTVETSKGRKEKYTPICYKSRDNLSFITYSGKGWTGFYKSNRSFYSLNLDKVIEDTSKSKLTNNCTITQNIISSQTKNSHLQENISTNIKPVKSSTPVLPTLSTTSVPEGNLFPNSATFYSTVTSDGGDPVTSRGFCWATVPNPSLSLGSKRVVGSGTGSFNTSVTNLVTNTVYYVRSFATNSQGTSYGTETQFRTLPNNSFYYNPMLPIPKILPLYIELTNDIHVSLGSDYTTSLSFITNVFNGIFYLYAREGITLELNKVYIWENMDPYGYTTQSSSLSAIQIFSTRISNSLPTNPESPYRIQLTNKAYGGIANCNCFSDGYNTLGIVNPTTNSVSGLSLGSGLIQPSLIGYNWTLQCVAHELGHQTGSQHTHWCGWKNDLGVSISKLDSCYETTTGLVSGQSSCVTIPAVARHPTIMSYCHFGNQPNKINVFRNGFGKYPRFTMRSTIRKSQQGLVPVIYNISLPEVTTSNPIIGITSAICTGEVINEGEYPVLNRGICWGTTPNPVITTNIPTIFLDSAENFIRNGIGLGQFVVNLQNLQSNTTYYIRSFAINLSGITYGNEISFTTNQPLLPNIKTYSPTVITNRGFTSGGFDIQESGSSIISRGICWTTSPSQDPTIDNDFKINYSTSLISNFKDTITTLQPLTTYYFRAFVTNGVGTSYGEKFQVTTLSSSSVVFEPFRITRISTTSVTLSTNLVSDGGMSLTNKGIAWSTTINPTIDQNSINFTPTLGIYESLVSELLPNTLYYFRSFVTTMNGETIYSTNVSATTRPSPIFSVEYNYSATNSFFCTLKMTSITAPSGTHTQAGVFFSNSNNLPSSTNYTGFRQYSQLISTGQQERLWSGTVSTGTYYVRGYIKDNDNFYHYTEPISFRVPMEPNVRTISISNVSTSSSQVNGQVIGPSSPNVVQPPQIISMGVLYTTVPADTLLSSPSSQTQTTTQTFNPYTITLNNLQSNTIYYARTFATNFVGTGYGSVLSFTTLPDITLLPTLTTSPHVAGSASGLAFATSGGNITSDGGSPVTSRGVVWSTSSGPTVESNQGITNNGSGTGQFVSELVGILPNNFYYARAYATNQAGTSYGNEIYFGIPELSDPLPMTGLSQSPTSTTIISGGSFLYAGTLAILEKGVCWSTNENPTISNNKTIDGNGTSAWVSNITNLLPSTTYYIRAYAKTSNGIVYAQQVSVTTQPSGDGNCQIVNLTSFEGLQSKWYLKYNINTNCASYKVELCKYSGNPTINSKLQPVQTQILNNMNPGTASLSEITNGYIERIMKPQPFSDQTFGSWFSLNVKCNGNCSPNTNITKYYFYIPPQ